MQQKTKVITIISIVLALIIFLVGGLLFYIFINVKEIRDRKVLSNFTTSFKQDSNNELEQPKEKSSQNNELPKQSSRIDRTNNPDNTIKSFSDLNYGYKKISKDMILKLQKTGTYDWDEYNEYALIFLDKSKLDFSYSIVQSPDWIIDLGDNKKGIEVVCDDIDDVDRLLKSYFSDKDTEFSLLKDYFNIVYPLKKIEDYDPFVEHSTFFFYYKGHICHPYPILLTGYGTSVTDTRLTIFSNWNIQHHPNTIKTSKRAELLLVTHNHPNDYGYTDLASPDDYGKPFFAYNSDGILVAGPLGFHVIRKKVDVVTDYCDYHNDIFIPTESIRSKFKAKYGDDYIRHEDYRRTITNLIFSNPNVQKALEQHFYKRN